MAVGDVLDDGVSGVAGDIDVDARPPRLARLRASEGRSLVTPLPPAPPAYNADIPVADAVNRVAKPPTPSIMVVLSRFRGVPLHEQLMVSLT